MCAATSVSACCSSVSFLWLLKLWFSWYVWFGLMPDCGAVTISAFKIAFREVFSFGFWQINLRADEFWWWLWKLDKCLDVFLLRLSYIINSNQFKCLDVWVPFASLKCSVLMVFCWNFWTGSIFLLVLFDHVFMPVLTVIYSSRLWHNSELQQGICSLPVCYRRH